MAEQKNMKNLDSSPELSEKQRQAAAHRELTDSDLNQVVGGSNPDAWKTCDHVWDTYSGCPRIPEFTYCMRCGQTMSWIMEHT